jgi:hypothetical protein
MTLSTVAARATSELATQVINNTRWLRDSQPEGLDAVAVSLMAAAVKLRAEADER